MAVRYLKRAHVRGAVAEDHVASTVASMLTDIEERGEEAAREYGATHDGWTGDVVVAEETTAAAQRALPQSTKDDILFARDRVAEFARRQRESSHEFEAEMGDGIVTGQRLLPVETAGCYVPGGRYAHVASAVMSVTTAKVAGVANIVAASPPRPGIGIHPAILFTLDAYGADVVLALGGVQGVASLAFGLFTGKPADIVAGPGNAYVSEAKRQLFGRIGIDVIAGPTEVLVIADDTADPEIVAADIAGQVEHGPDSPAWLISLSEPLAQAVMEAVPRLVADLPEPGRSAASEAWRDLGEVAVADGRDEARDLADRLAPEHLHVQARDLDWWLQNLTSYGSLFLGEETSVTFGDKVSGPNHILPTAGAGRYSGGLSVARFIKVLTYQRMTRQGTRALAPAASRISRLEGMEGHARSGDVRLAKYFPGEKFDLTPASADPPGRGA